MFIELKDGSLLAADKIYRLIVRKENNEGMLLATTVAGPSKTPHTVVTGPLEYVWAYREVLADRLGVLRWYDIDAAVGVKETSDG